MIGVELKSDKEKFEERMIDREWKDGENQWIGVSGGVKGLLESDTRESALNDKKL